MADRHVVNLKDGVEDMARKFGIEGLESRFARVPLERQESGLSYFKVAPGARPPFGHPHGRQEEIYVLISGSARLKLDDEIIELRPWDAVRIPGPGRVRSRAAGRGRVARVRLARRTATSDAEMVPDLVDGS